MWLKTKIGKRVNIKSTEENAEWDGPLVEVDAVGLTINDTETGLTFIPHHSIFAVRILEP
ncbi:MAG: hypothetical protein WCB79_11350 [Halobacteriota archaeon]